MPEGIIEQLTVQYWWNRNDVMHHPNADMYFQPRAGLYRFQTKDEGMLLVNVIKDFIDGDIHQQQPMAIMRFMCILIFQEEYLLQRHWLFSHSPEFVLPPTISLTDAFKTIGNGVPYVAAHAIANTIYDYIHQHNPAL